MFFFYRLQTLGLCFAIILSLHANAQLRSDQFVECGAEMGLLQQDFASWGSAWGDANGDGFPDLFIGNHYQKKREDSAPMLYLSTAEGRFKLDSLPNYDATPDMHGAGWLDFDNDGDQDLIITTGRVNRNAFYVNDGTGNFVEQAVELGADFPMCRGRTPLFFDQNRDGILDILIAAGPTVSEDQLPTSLALSNPSCSPTCYHLVGADSAGVLPDLASTQALLVDPDGDDQLNPMLVTLSFQLWGAFGCLPFSSKGATTISFTNEVLAADFNGDMVQDLLFLRNRMEQSYIDNPFPVNNTLATGIGPLNPTSLTMFFPPQHGVYKIGPGTELGYRPNEAFTGADSLMLGFCDSNEVCQTKVIRFYVTELLDGSIPISGVKVVKDSSVSVDLEQLFQPYRFRMLCNLSATGGFEGFRFSALSDTILIGFDEGAPDPSTVYIGPEGYHPATSNRFMLQSSDFGNQGKPVDFLSGPSPKLLLSFDTLSSTWTIGWASVERSRILFSVLSPGELNVVEYINFDSVPKTLGNVLLMGHDGAYLDATSLSGLAVPSESFSVSIGDFDNDMDLDIYYSCGIMGRNVSNILLENDGLGRFSIVELAGGAQGVNYGAAGTVSTTDFNRDGFLDLFVANGRSPEKKGLYLLFRNKGNDNHWIGLTLTGTQSNRDGIGAVVRAYAGGKGQIRYADGGFHRYVQNDPIIHFGLGSNKYLDSITVRWPSGVRSVLTNIKADQFLNIVEPVDGAPACFAPPGGKAFFTAEGIEFRWRIADCAQGYEFRVRTVLPDDPSMVLSTTDTFALLKPSFFSSPIPYYWTVRALCESGALGQFAPLQQVIPHLGSPDTDEAALKSQSGFMSDEAQISLHPNPVRNQINLKGLEESSSVVVYDLQGREQMRAYAEPGRSISTHQLQSGSYLLHLDRYGMAIPFQVR